MKLTENIQLGDDQAQSLKKDDEIFCGSSAPQQVVAHTCMLNTQCTCILDPISCMFESQSPLLPIKIVFTLPTEKNQWRGHF